MSSHLRLSVVMHTICSMLKVHNAQYLNLKALGHDISKRFVTKLKRIVCGPSFR